MNNKKMESALNLYRHFDDLERYSSGLSEDAVEKFISSEAEIFNLIYRIASEKIGTDYRSNKKLDVLRNKISQIRYDAADKVLELFQEQSHELISVENTFLFSVLIILFQRRGGSISQADANRIIRYGKYHGLTRKQIIEKITGNDISRIYEAIASGVSNAKRAHDIIQDVARQTRNTRRYIRSETNVIVNGIVNDVSLAFAAKNRLNLLYSSMMDDKACDDCKDLHGAVYEYNATDIPSLPLHIACRCRLIPIAGKEFSDSELNISFQDYFDSLSDAEKSQRIGSIKYAGYRNGILKINGFIEPLASARLSLSEISRRDAETFLHS